MAAVKANGIEIEYSDSGAPDSPVIVLIMGLGMQLIAWPDAFCEGLLRAGFASFASTIAMPGCRQRCHPPGGCLWRL